MKTNFVRAASVAALMSTAAAIVVMPTSATAQMGGGMAPTNSAPPAHAKADAGKVSPAVAKPLSEAQKDLQAKDYPSALTAIQQAQALPNQTPIDTYTINRFLAAVAIDMKDMTMATKASEDAADSPAMPDEDKKDTLHNALILSYNAKDYAKTITYGQQLDQMNLLDNSSAATLAVAYYDQKDTANAKIYAQKSIDLAKAAGVQPDEAVMQIIMNGQAATDQNAAAATLEKLVITYNRPDDWDELANYYITAKGTSNPDGLNLYRVLYIQGPMKTANDYTFMGSLAGFQHCAVEARNVLQAGITAGKISGSEDFNKARNDAAGDEKIISQAIAAAAKSKKGDDDLQIAQDLWGYGRYAEVESIATAAKAKGVKDPGEATVLIGMAQIAQNNYDAGIATLAQVNGSAGHERPAHLWTDYAQIKKAGGTAAPSH